MLRTSNYTIVVPIPGRSENILVHGYTGSIDLVDEKIASYLSDSQNNVQSQLPPFSAQAADYLEQRGYLTQKTSSEEEQRITEVAEAGHRHADSLAPKIYLMPTYECNLRCTYCFEHPIRQMGRREGWAADTLSTQHIAAAFRAMNELYEVYQTKSKSLTLYGGEALMPEHHSCIEEIVRLAQDENYAVMAATHGRDLDQFMYMIGSTGIVALHVPVDGTQETHDVLRVGPHRSPTFSRIIKNLHLALERGARIRMRVNVNRMVLDRLDEFADFLESEGFTRSALFSCYLNAIFATTSTTPQQRQSSSYVAEYEIAEKLATSPRLSRIFTGYPVVHDRIYSLFTATPATSLSPLHCCGGANTFVFDPLGRIFPCNNIVGEREHQIGSYFPQLIWNDATRRHWQARSAESMPGILKCKYALFCGGGSPYDSFTRTRAISCQSCECEYFSRTFAAYVVAALHRLSNYQDSTL
jgi:uncharacterized protein